MASASTPSANEPARPHLSPHSMAKANDKKLISSGISDVAFASVYGQSHYFYVL